MKMGLKRIHVFFVLLCEVSPSDMSFPLGLYRLRLDRSNPKQGVEEDLLDICITIQVDVERELIHIHVIVRGLSTSTFLFLIQIILIIVNGSTSS